MDEDTLRYQLSEVRKLQGLSEINDAAERENQYKSMIRGLNEKIKELETTPATSESVIETPLCIPEETQPVIKQVTSRLCSHHILSDNCMRCNVEKELANLILQHHAVHDNPEPQYEEDEEEEVEEDEESEEHDTETVYIRRPLGSTADQFFNLPTATSPGNNRTISFADI